MRRNLILAEMSAQLAGEVLGITTCFLLIGPGFTQRTPHPFGRGRQVFDQRLQVIADIAGRTEMREEQGLRPPRVDPPDCLRPQLNVDVGGLRSAHALVKEPPHRTPLSAIKLMREDAAELDRMAEEIKAKYTQIFRV